MALFFFFVLIRNDWSLDVAHLDTMLNRAFGLESDKPATDELRGLLVSLPVIKAARLSSGDAVIMAQGLVKNNDTRPRRFIYVKVTISRHGTDVASSSAPAANIFTSEQLAKMTKAGMLGRIVSRGQDGSNARLEPGQSVDYMVVITKVPPDFSPTRYSAEARVTEAEVPMN